MEYNIDYSSSATTEKGMLGTVEADASGLNGSFKGEKLRGQRILDKMLSLEFETVLDVGAGAFDHSKEFLKNGRIVDAVDYGESVYYKPDNTNGIRKVYIGDFNRLEFSVTYDALWCSHILEHQLNVNQFLRKVNQLINEGGYLGIVVPPRKPFVVGGHLTLWNAGILIYNLVMAGFDCSEHCMVLQYDYNIGLIVKKKTISSYPDDLSMDKGDLEKLSQFFPFEAKHGFNGDIMKLNWD